MRVAKPVANSLRQTQIMLAKRLLKLLLPITLPALSATASAQDWQTAFPGVDVDTFMSGATRVHAARIDLCQPGVRMRATAPGEGPRTTSSYAGLVDAEVAINGDWWARDGFNPDLPQTTFPRGLAMGNGQHFAGTVDPNFYGFVAFGANMAMHSIMEDDGGGPEFWMREVVSGQPTLLWDGQLRNNPNSHCGVRRARTATGFSQDMETMYLAVVDERNGSTGMTCNEMAALMQSIGAHSALNQDGGGSSTMFIKGQGVVNSPSDGSQRSLVNHWGVQAEGSGPPAHCVSREVPTILEGVKRHVPNPTEFANWRLDGADIMQYGQEWVDAFAEEPPFPSEPRLLIAPGDIKVYLVDGAFKRHVPSPRAMAAWRFSFAEVQEDTSGELDALVEGPPLLETPVTIRGDGPAVYFIDHPAADLPDPGEDPGSDPDPGEEPGSGNGDPSNEESEELAGGCAVGSSPSSAAGLLLLIAMALPWRRKRRDGR